MAETINNQNSAGNINETTDPLEQFTDYLIAEAGYKNLPESYASTFRDQVRAQVYRRVGMIVMNELNEADAKEFADKFGAELGQSNNAAAQEFLSTKIENFPEKLVTGLNEFAEEFFRLRQE